MNSNSKEKASLFCDLIYKNNLFMSWDNTYYNFY